VEAVTIAGTGKGRENFGDRRGEKAAGLVRQAFDFTPDIMGIKVPGGSHQDHSGQRMCFTQYPQGCVSQCRKRAVIENHLFTS
tara:strand:- start:6907 stop:7155 length:249 start_codon:yes stop_codon:yes gene_type:complete